MQTAIIIGVGPGLGIAIAEAFGHAGLHVALMSRSEKNLRLFSEEFTDKGIAHSVHAVDVSDFSALRQELRRIAQQQAVEVLVYNVVKRVFNTPLELDVEQMVEAYRIDVAAALLSVQTLQPFMEEREGGTILFTGSGAALHPWTEAPTISIAKAGIRSLAYMLADEMSESPLRVGTVTIFGMIKQGTDFDPAKIAAAYVQHWQNGVPEVELQYKG
ncbi:MAG: SDR family NAD(P)-dependent oxidoreductase [Bacteroidetes bacterium]|nr:MAG: SDR family NAD(P)-dependent oxidoreductase [Bacteroidota bacterium]